MFTGIIEKLGKIRALTSKGEGFSLEVEVSEIWDDLKIGESIAVNGACLTLTAVKGNRISFDVSPETKNKTTLGKLPPGTIVNLERALKLSDRLGGHIVLGHVDGIGKISAILNEGNFFRFEILIPQELTKYTAYKGSIAVDGISLTVADIKDNRISVAVIPHTYNHTNMHTLRQGDEVNIEVDIIARYVERLLNRESASITEEFLKKHGFI